MKTLKISWDELLMLVLIGLAMLVFSSCKVLEKESSESYRKADSVSIVKESISKTSKLDSAGLLLKNDSSIVQTKHDYQRETVIEEYPFITGDSAVKLWKAGHPVKRTTIKETGSVAALQTNTASLNQSSNVSRSNDSSGNKQANVEVTKEMKLEESSKNVTTPHWFLYAVGCMLLVFVIAALYVRWKARQIEGIRNIFK